MILPELKRSTDPATPMTWEGSFATPDAGGRLHFFVNDAVMLLDPGVTGTA